MEFHKKNAEKMTMMTTKAKTIMTTPLPIFPEGKGKQTTDGRHFSP